MTGIIKNEHESFNVYLKENQYSFCHIDIKDENKFYKSLFNYFFNEDKLLGYAENNFHLKFTPSKISYSKLYKNLLFFIDQKNLLRNVDLTTFEQTIDRILNDELNIENKEGENYIRIDKFGKIGEYIFSHILSEYFKLDCIIPKIKLTTSYNMSVFGIDTLFYSSKNNLIFFGESKVSKSIENGVELIKHSLKDYERQIKNEFLLTLSNRMLNCNKDFLNIFKNHIDECIDFDEFAKCANIRAIGIPVFIAHGCDNNNLNIEHIFKELSRLPQKALCDLDTTYYSISLPIINKDKLMASFTREMQNKEAEYKNAR